MATFSEVFNLTGDVNPQPNGTIPRGRNVATDGDDIYFWDVAGDQTLSGFWKFDPLLTSETLIFKNSEFGTLDTLSSQNQPMLMCFDKTIFMCAGMADGSYKVWRFSNGMLILDFTISLSEVGRNITLYADSDQIVIHIGKGTGNPTGRFKITVNGAWSSVVFAAWPTLTDLNEFRNFSRDFRTLGIVAQDLASATIDIYKFIGNDWIFQVVASEKFEISGQTHFWHETLDPQAGASFVGRHSTDFLTVTATATAERFTQQLNMPTRIAEDFVSTRVDVFNFADPNWASFDTAVPLFVHETDEYTPWGIRIDNGDVYYLFAPNDDDWRVYKRSSALGTTPNSWARTIPPITITDITGDRDNIHFMAANQIFQLAETGDRITAFLFGAGTANFTNRVDVFGDVDSGQYWETEDSGLTYLDISDVGWLEAIYARSGYFSKLVIEDDNINVLSGEVWATEGSEPTEGSIGTGAINNIPKGYLLVTVPSAVADTDKIQFTPNFGEDWQTRGDTLIGTVNKLL